MLNHTYTSVKNANLVDCGKKQHIPSQPSVLLRDNFLSEYRTELDKKKVLANLGIVTDLLLEWEYIKGDIGKSESLMNELDSRTKYISEIDGFQKSIIDGIKYLESVIGGEQEGEDEQNERLTELETLTKTLVSDLEGVKEYLTNTMEVDIKTLQESLATITEKVDNITNLIQVSSKSGNALRLISDEELAEGETSGLYVPDLSEPVNKATENITKLNANVETIQKSLDAFVTKEDLGGGDFDFVNQEEFKDYIDKTDKSISDINSELESTVKTGEDGHVDTLYVNAISKDNNDGNIIITDSFEVNSGIPLDIRFVRENLEDLYSLPAAKCYSGMGVIVNSLSALYILRKPEEGVTINQDYISNPNNWKCPEDLVTIALTRDEYETLEEINPNVFYYIYEDEIARTQEPKREDYEDEESFNVAWQEWVDSLKTLSQEYMSASWGVDIENKLSQKASNEAVNTLIQEINNIKGNDSGVSLDSLNKEIKELQNESEAINARVDEIIITTDEGEQGRLIDVEKEIESVKGNLDNYVTKEYIQDSSNNFIFVKNDDYQSDKKSFTEALATEVTTNKVNTSEIKLGEIVIKNVDGRLQQNGSDVANIEDIPKLEVLSQTDYDALQEKDEDTYYYTFDGNDVYVTQTELTNKLALLQSQINTLLTKISTLEDTVAELQSNTGTE